MRAPCDPAHTTDVLGDPVRRPIAEPSDTELDDTELDDTEPSATELAVIRDALAALRTVHARVAAVERVASGLVELTIAGLTGTPYLELGGGDHFVYVMVSDEPEGLPAGYGMTEHRTQAPGGPVRGAYYTVRSVRPARGELVVWAVDHGHPGSVSAWCSRAVPGERLALWGPRRGFRIPDDVRHLLLVADETGIAAVAALIETLPLDRRATAVLECSGVAGRPPMPDHPGLRIAWVERGDDEPGATDRLLDAVRALGGGPSDPFGAPDAAFGAGESRRITAVRRHVRARFGMPAARMSMTGYWRRQEP